MKYTDKLKILYNKIDDDFEREVYYHLLLAYSRFLKGERLNKNVTKEYLMRKLVARGLIMPRPGKTGVDSLPDDRKLREVARDLLRRGYPILADSGASGYYIADSLDEIARPKAENESRAKAILAVNKGYDKVAKLIAYDTPIDEMVAKEG